MPRRSTRRTGAHSQSGASAVEYALIVAGMAVVLLVVAGRLQSSVKDAYVAAGVSISQAPTTPSATTAHAPTSTTTSEPETETETESPSSTATPPAGAVSVARGASSAGVAIGWANGAKSFQATQTPTGRGTSAIVNDKLVFTPNANSAKGLVTISWSFTKGKDTVTGTSTFWVT